MRSCIEQCTEILTPVPIELIFQRKRIKSDVSSQKMKNCLYVQRNVTRRKSKESASTTITRHCRDSRIRHRDFKVRLGSCALPASLGGRNRKEIYAAPAAHGAITKRRCESVFNKDCHNFY